MPSVSIRYFKSTCFNKKQRTERASVKAHRDNDTQGTGTGSVRCVFTRFFFFVSALGEGGEGGGEGKGVHWMQLNCDVETIAPT